jgi:hypothetical protein
MAGRKQKEGGEGGLEHLMADMPPPYARGKMRGSGSDGLDQLPGGLDHFLQAAGHLEVA